MRKKQLQQRFVAGVGDFFSAAPIVNIFSAALTGYLLGVLGSEEDGDIHADNGMALTLFTYAIEFFPFVAMIPMWSYRVHVAIREADKRREASGGEIS